MTKAAAWLLLVPLATIACAQGAVSATSSPTARASVEQSPVTEATPSPATEVTPSPPPPTVRVLVQLGQVSAMALNSRAVYALYAPSSTEGSLEGANTEMVARIDRRSGAVLTAGPFPGAFTIAATARSVWLGGILRPYPSAAVQPIGLVRLDADSLGVSQRLALAPATRQWPLAARLGADSTGLWLAYGSHLSTLDELTGAPVKTVSIGGLASSIAVDSATQRIYVGTIPQDPSRNFSTVGAWQMGSLTRLASAETGGGDLGGPEVAASGVEVWVAFATGMLGQVEHLRYPDLREVPSRQTFTNGVRVFVAGGIVWTTDGMASRMTCLDPTSGAVLADSQLQLGGVIVGDGSSIYMGDGTGVSTLTPDSRCR